MPPLPTRGAQRATQGPSRASSDLGATGDSCNGRLGIIHIVGHSAPKRKGLLIVRLHSPAFSALDTFDTSLHLRRKSPSSCSPVPGRVVTPSIPSIPYYRIIYIHAHVCVRICVAFSVILTKGGLHYNMIDDTVRVQKDSNSRVSKGVSDPPRIPVISPGRMPQGYFKRRRLYTDGRNEPGRYYPGDLRIDPEEFTSWVRSLRRRHEMSALDMATYLGVSLATVYSYEKGSTTPKDATYRLLQDLSEKPYMTKFYYTDKRCDKWRFARWVKKARLVRGMSVTDLASMIGRSSSSIYGYEEARVMPTDETFKRLYWALKLRDTPNSIDKLEALYDGIPVRADGFAAPVDEAGYELR